MVYRMDRQLAQGEAAEALLDRHFAGRFAITPATREQQRQGIDRIFVQRQTSKAYTIEYKTDWTAAKTGNAFVETVSVDTLNKPGWAYASQAQWLVYYVPGLRRVYLIDFIDLRKLLPQWVAECKAAPPIPNKGYNTLGILTPLAQFARCASRIEQVNM